MVLKIKEVAQNHIFSDKRSANFGQWFGISLANLNARGSSTKTPNAF